MIEELKQIRESLQGALDESDGNELNMSNYHHDDVHGLNNAYVTLWMTIEQQLAALDKLIAGAEQDWRGLLAFLDTSECAEAVAKAIYANDPATANGKSITWEDCGEVFPERVAQCEEDAQSALSAIKRMVRDGQGQQTKGSEGKE